MARMKGSNLVSVSESVVGPLAPGSIVQIGASQLWPTTVTVSMNVSILGTQYYAEELKAPMEEDKSGEDAEKWIELLKVDV